MQPDRAPSIPKPPLSFSGLPSIPAIEALKALPQWVAWRYVWKEDKQKWDKPPFDPLRDRMASATDANTWGPFPVAERYARNKGETGVGFVLAAEDGLTGIDLDKCRDPETGALEAWAQDIISLGETYCEVSPSGCGVRMFALGKVEKALKFDPAHVEVYGGGRYLTVTGQHLPGTPEQIHAAPRTLAALKDRVDSMKPKPPALQPYKPPANGIGARAAAGVQSKPGKSDFFRNVNDAALADLGSWFPSVLPSAKPAPGTNGWRVASADLGRNLEEDLSATPSGIVDFGVADMGDGRDGRRTPIDIVMEHGGVSKPVEAARWLCERLGRDPSSLGWVDKAKGENFRQRSPEAAATNAGEVLEPGTDIITQDRVALVFAAKAEGRLRFCHSTGAWYRWTGHFWRRDQTNEAFQFARELSRAASDAGTVTELKEARKVSFAGGVEKFARGDGRLAVTHEAWDADPMLLGTPTGTVDLSTGKLRPSQSWEGITKVTAVAPAEHPECPTWLAFLKEATRGDDALIRFLQQWCGYCLTGLTREHALIFVYGDGGNGKSVFLNTVTHILGDYAVTAAMDTFTASKNDRHSTELAMLKGARIVTASETEEGRAWAEARIKQVTGSDPITARFMRQDNFTFTPAFKLTVVGNHKPVLHNVDDAARRRFNMVPFIHKPAVPDRQLEEKLKKEAAGILRWMIGGCIDWQTNRLVRPPVVVKATEAYFSDQDSFKQWLEEECEREASNDHKFETVKDLYAAWSEHARAAGEEPGSAKSFGDRMERAECPRGRISKGIRVHYGVLLKKKRQQMEATQRMTGDYDG